MVKNRKLIYQYLGDLYLNMKKYNKAAVSFEQALLFSKKNKYLYYKLANIYIKLNKPFLAINMLQSVIAIHKRFLPAYFFLGSLYSQKKFFKEAGKVFLEAARINFRQARPYLYNLAARYYNEKDFSALKELCKQLLAINSGDLEFKKMLREAKER